VRYAEARRHALSLPEATEAPHFDFGSFRVRGKIFATVPPGQTHLHTFVGDEERDYALAFAPEATEKLWWGTKVVGVRVHLATADVAFVKRLLDKAWARSVPGVTASSQARPMAALAAEAMRIPSFACSTSRASVKASCAMKIDMVKPMPPSQAAPMKCGQATPEGRRAIPGPG
jgi:hypothetical protein